MEYEKFYKFLERRPLSEIVKCQQTIDDIVIQRKIENIGEASLEALNQSQSESETQDEAETLRVKNVMDNIITTNLLVPHGMNGYNRETKRFVRWVPGYNRPAPPIIASQQNIQPEWFLHKEMQLFIHWCPDGYYEMSCKDSLKFNQNYPANSHLLPKPAVPVDVSLSGTTSDVNTKDASALEKRKLISFVLPGKEKKLKSIKAMSSIAQDWSYFSESEEEERESPEAKMREEPEQTVPHLLAPQAECSSETVATSSVASTAAQYLSTTPVSRTGLKESPEKFSTSPPILLPPPALSVASSSDGSPRQRLPAVGDSVRVTQGTMKGEVGTVLGTHWASETVFRVQFLGKRENFAKEYLQVTARPPEVRSPIEPVVPAPVVLAPAPTLNVAPLPEPEPVLTPAPLLPTLAPTPQLVPALPHLSSIQPIQPVNYAQAEAEPTPEQVQAVPSSLPPVPLVPPVAPSLSTPQRRSTLTSRVVSHGVGIGGSIVTPAYPTGPHNSIVLPRQPLQHEMFPAQHQMYFPYGAYGPPPIYPPPLQMPPQAPMGYAPQPYHPPPSAPPHQQHFYHAPPLAPPAPEAPPLAPPPVISRAAPHLHEPHASVQSPAPVSAPADGVCWVRVKSGMYVNEEGEFLSQNAQDTTLARVKFFNHYGKGFYITQIKVCDLAVFSITNRAKEVPLDMYLTVRKMGLPSGSDTEHSAPPADVPPRLDAPLMVSQVDHAPSESRAQAPRQLTAWLSDHEQTVSEKRQNGADPSALHSSSDLQRHSPRRSPSPRRPGHGSDRSSNLDRREDRRAGRSRERRGDSSRHYLSSRQPSPSPPRRASREQRGRDSERESTREGSASDGSNRTRDERERRRGETEHEWRARIRSISHANNGEREREREWERDKEREREREKERLQEEEQDRERWREAGRERKREREEKAERDMESDRDNERDRDHRRFNVERERADQRNRDDRRTHQDREIGQRENGNRRPDESRASPSREQTTASTLAQTPTPTTNGYLRNVMHSLNVPVSAPERVRTVGLAERPRDPFPLRAGHSASLSKNTPVTILNPGDLVKVARGPHAGLIAVIVEPPNRALSDGVVLEEYVVLLNDGRNTVVRLTADLFVVESS